MAKDSSREARETGGSSPSRRGLKFSRESRLLRHSDFERVYKGGRRHFASRLTVFYLPRQDGGGFRVGFTVGKALGGAVERNRMKRRLRAAGRLHLPQVQAPVDIVINPKKIVLSADFAELENEISRAFAVVQKSVESKAATKSV